MASAEQPETEFKWEELEPITPNRHQFGAAILGFLLLFVGIPFVNDVSYWWMAPRLFGLTCLAYGTLAGSNWYREEMLPSMTRVLEVSESQKKQISCIKILCTFIYPWGGHSWCNPM